MSNDLFKLSDDLGEQRNLADDRPDFRKRLANELQRYLASADAQAPVDKRTGRPVPLPGARDNN
jgi:hypothetical protein